MLSISGSCAIIFKLVYYISLGGGFIVRTAVLSKAYVSSSRLFFATHCVIALILCDQLCTNQLP